MPQDPAGTAYELTEGRGAGAPIVLIHGVGLDRAMWAAQVRALADLGPVLTYDMLGHGQTPARLDRVRLADFRDQLAALLTYLSVRDCRLVGFSMGSLVARAFATRWPERVERLALISTVFSRNMEARAAVRARYRSVAREGIAAAVEPALARWFTPAYAAAHPEAIDAIRRRLLANDPTGYLIAYGVFIMADLETSEALARIACPSLVMTGSDDPNSTPEMTVKLARELRNARALVLPGRRHMMPIEAADEVNAVLLDFLQSAG